MIKMSLLVILSTAALYAAQPNSENFPVVAQVETGNCSEAVSQVLASNDGRLLSIRRHSDRCTVIVLIQNEGQRPEKKVFRISMPIERQDGG